MIYAKVLNGVVTEIKDTSLQTFVFVSWDEFKTFTTWLRIDQLDPMPQIGWHYDKDTGFTEN